jgi:hypothetical protein
MSTDFNGTTTTTEEYFKILERDHLTPEEITKKDSYESFINNCKKYESLISPTAQSILSDYNSRVLGLGTKGNRTPLEESAFDDFKKPFNTEKEVEGPVRRLAKSGYIDATVILLVILNIGFIIAFTLLKS